jgi:hypothetical protein
VTLRLERIERESSAQFARTSRGASTEISEAVRIAVDARDDLSVRFRRQRDMTAESG